MRLTRLGQIGTLTTAGTAVSFVLIGLFTYFSFFYTVPALLPVVVQTEHFRIHADDLDLADVVAALAEENLRRIESEILPNRRKSTSRIDVFVWKSKRHFRKSAAFTNISEAGTSRLIAEFDGSILRRIDIIAPDSIKTVLPHEVAHMLLCELDMARIKNGFKPIPLALHEGIAILAEGKCNDILLMKAGLRMNASECTDMSTCVANMDCLLRCENYASMPDMCDFYALSYSLAEYLMAELKPQGLARLLELMENGKAFDEAVQLAMGDTSESFRHNFIHKWYAHSKRNTDALIAMR